MQIKCLFLSVVHAKTVMLRFIKIVNGSRAWRGEVPPNVTATHEANPCSAAVRADIAGSRLACFHMLFRIFLLLWL